MTTRRDEPTFRDQWKRPPSPDEPPGSPRAPRTMQERVLELDERTRCMTCGVVAPTRSVQFNTYGRFGGETDGDLCRPCIGKSYATHVGLKALSILSPVAWVVNPVLLVKDTVTYWRARGLPLRFEEERGDSGPRGDARRPGR